jgi:Domain of unknown function (DUF4157)/Bacterial toxin 3
MWHAAERHAVTLYRHAADSGEVDENDPAITAALEQRGSGQPLPDQLRQEMEAELQVSLDRVRVHTDSVAAKAALAVRAEAFTVGEDIFFAENAFVPETSEGRKLLAHELAHVTQSLRGRGALARGGIQVSRPNDMLEREAEIIAEQVARNVRQRDRSRSGALDPLGARSFEASLGERMSRLLGSDLTKAPGYPRSPAASGAAKAVTIAGQIHGRGDAYQPGTSAGDWLVAHELAKVVHQQGHSGDRVGMGEELERGACRTAKSGMQGTPTGIELHASAGKAHAVSVEDRPLNHIDERTNEGHGETDVSGNTARADDATIGPSPGSSAGPEEVLARVTAGTPETLPFRTALEQFFGPLPAIDAFIGRGELGELGAIGAAAGRTVVFAEATPSLPVVAHEVAHVLQQEHTGAAVIRRRQIASEDAPAEREADAAASAIASGNAAVFPVRERSAPIVHLNRGRQEPTGPTNPSGLHQIRGTPFEAVVAGANVTYEVRMGPEIMSQGSLYKYAWKCINDPATRGAAPAEVAGPRTHRWNAHWDFGGHHKIVCTVQFHPAGESPRPPEELSYWQLVRSVEEVEEEKKEEALLRLINPTAFTEPQASAFTPGSTKVSPEVAVKILENMAKGEPAFKPELGKGGCSWFVTEGNPYVGIDQSKNVSLPVELDRTANPVVFDEAKLDAMFKTQLAKVDMQAIEATYRAKEGLPPEASLNSKARKLLAKVAKGIAESKMWDEVAAEVRRSSSKVGEVILENSQFSKQGDGKFLVVADAKKIQVKGGMTAVVEALEAGGPKVEPVVAEAVEKTAARLKWAGRVRGAFRYGGRILIVVAVAADAYRIYHAQDKVKTIVETAGGWTAASLAAAGFAEVFAPADVAGPWAWAAHGVGTLIAGGIGYWVGSSTTRTIYEIIVEEPQ